MCVVEIILENEKKKKIELLYQRRNPFATCGGGEGVPPLQHKSICPTAAPTYVVCVYVRLSFNCDL